MDISVTYGLSSALSYGTADYLSQKAGRAVGAWRAAFYYYLLGFAALSIWIVLHPHELDRAQGAPRSAWLLAIGSGLALLTAVVLFTQGLTKGRIAVVAPVTASYGAITTLLTLAAGQRLSIYGAVAIALTIAGACLVAIPVQRDASLGTKSGVGWAVGAALAYGVGFWIQGEFAVPMLGSTLPIWIVYAIGSAIMGGLHLANMINLALPNRTSLFYPVLLSGALSILGFLALTMGVGTGRVAVVVVLSSLTSAITVILAWLFNDTRLGFHQWLAIVLITAGLALLRA